MIKFYTLIAWRNILKNKSFSFINIIGLAMSMAVCLLIISVIADQKSYDQFQTKKDRVYRILSTGKGSNFMKRMYSSALPLGEELQANHPGIEAAAGITRGFGGELVYNDKIAIGGGYFADGNLFKILDFKLLEGDPKTALNAPRSLVIAEELSKQLFRNEDPIGKVVQFNHTGVNPMGVDHGNRETDYGLFTITGVLKPVEGKTHLPLSLLASLSTLPVLARDSIREFKPNDWENVFSNYTYVLLQEGGKESDLQSALDKISDKYYPQGTENQYAFKTQSLKNTTLDDALGNPTHLQVPKPVIWVLSILCLIVMLSACLNYTNLSIARSLTRAKEIGIRKVTGARRRQIFAQFIVESVVVSLISLILSIGILSVLEALFSSLMFNQYLKITFDHPLELYPIFIGFSIVVGLIAGLSPAIYMSAFNPIQILKNLNSVRMFRRLTLRKGLLAVQFGISLIFIISAVLIYLQTHQIFNFDYGFNKDNVINIRLSKAEHYTRFSQAVSANKDILAVSACDILPSTGSSNGGTIHKDDLSKDSLEVRFIDVDARCMDVWGLQLLAGKDVSDTKDGKQVLINETLLKELNYGAPSQALGQRLRIGTGQVEITGVVKDFQFLDVTQGVKPLLLRNRSEELSFITLRFTGNKAADVLPFLETTWKQVNPTAKFEYEFFDEQLLIAHTVMSNLAGILGFIAFLAVLISCLGLLGMATYTAETRQKEIGVRKVLGSSVGQIIYLLSKDYLRLLAVAVVIATPIAYFINNSWLEFFIQRVSITPWILIGCVFILLIISFLTVFSQSWRAARTNPVNSLRAE